MRVASHVRSIRLIRLSLVLLAPALVTPGRGPLAQSAPSGPALGQTAPVQPAPGQTAPTEPPGPGPAAPPAETPPAAQGGTPAPDVSSRSLAGTEAGAILGRSVTDSADQVVGPLVDILVDKNGMPVAGVIDVGGFFGVGTRRVAVAWHLLRFVPDNGETHIHLDMNFDTAAGAPEFEGPDSTLIVIDRAPP